MIATGCAAADSQPAEPAQIIELNDVSPAGIAVERVALNTSRSELPSLTFSNATLVSSEKAVRHQRDVYPLSDALRVGTEEEWLVMPSVGVSQEEAIETLVQQLEDVVSNMLGHDVGVLEYNDSLGALIRPVDSMPLDNPLWIVASVRPGDDGAVRVGITFNVEGVGLLDYTSEELVPASIADQLAIVDPLTELDGIKLIDYSVQHTGESEIVVEIERDANGPITSIACDEYENASEEVVAGLLAYDPSATLDEDAYDVSDLSGDLGQDEQRPEVAGEWKGELVSFQVFAACDSGVAVDVIGSTLTVDFHNEGPNAGR